MRDGETANDVPANTPSNASTAAPMTATGRKMTLPIEPASGSVATLLRDFFDAHAARSGAYERWNARYASTLRGEMSESAFVGVTTEVTGEMKELSEKILSIEEGLKIAERADAATLIRIVQQNERVRLEMTCALQVLKLAAAKREWTWQREADGTGAVNGVAGGENVVGSSIPHPSWARTVDENGQVVECPIGCACAREGGAPEPTEDEYVNAVAEATQALEGACSQINDAVEELRYELEDADEA